MRKIILCCIAMILLVCPGLEAQGVDTQASYEARARQYVVLYAPLAMKEQHDNGIPASVTLGQGILETEAGISELVTNANNHFGIKCKNGWEGETYTYTDDAPDECFKKYKCAADSYRDHSMHLKRNQRYSCLFALKPTDYKGWAAGLKKCGYATNPHYAQKLIEIIETFGLQQYTYTADTATDFTFSLKPKTDNGYKLYSASYVTQVDTPAKKTAAPAKAAPRIIIVNDSHTVKEGETVESIAKAENVDLKQLMAFNYLYVNEEPVPGSVLELQKQARRKPDVWIRSSAAHSGNAITSDNAAPGGDYVAINRNAAAQPQAATPADQQAQSAPAAPQLAPVHMHARPQSDQQVQVQASTPERDQQLVSMKSDLDKVVYADDSKLISQPAPSITATPVPQPRMAAPLAAGSKYYTVKKGDTAFSIAKRNNISVDDLMKWNGMTAAGVKVGQNLRIKE